MANTTLTKEYFDKVIGGFSKSVDSRFNQVDKRFKEQNKDLKTHVTNEIKKEVGGLAAITAREFDRVHAEFSRIHQEFSKVHQEFGKVHEGIENLAGMSAREFTNVNSKLDIMTEGQKNHEKRIKRVEKSLGIPEVI